MINTKRTAPAGIPAGTPAGIPAGAPAYLDLVLDLPLQQTFTYRADPKGQGARGNGPWRRSAGGNSWATSPGSGPNRPKAPPERPSRRCGGW